MRKRCCFGLLLSILLLFSACSAPQQTETASTDPAVGGGSITTDTDSDRSTSDSEGFITDTPENPPTVDIPENADPLTSVRHCDVQPGQTFEWTVMQHVNGLNSGASEYLSGFSSDSFWHYEYYRNGKYENMNYSKRSRIFTSSAGGTISQRGDWFQPAQGCNVVKTFLCPSGGRIVLDNTLWCSSGWSLPMEITFAVYLDNERVFPSDGSPYVVLGRDMTRPNYKITLDVKKNQQLRIHLGTFQSSDIRISMENKVTYQTVNEDTAYYALRCAHAQTEVVRISEPTCQTGGEVRCECLTCPYLKKTYLRRLSHKYTSYEMTQPLSAHNMGIMTRTCSDCGYEMRSSLFAVDEVTGILWRVFDTDLPDGLTVSAQDGGYYVDYARMHLFNGYFQINFPPRDGKLPSAVRYISCSGAEYLLDVKDYFGTASVIIYCPGLLIPIYS